MRKGVLTEEDAKDRRKWRKLVKAAATINIRKTVEKN